MQLLVSMPAGCNEHFQRYMGRANVEAERRLPVHQAQRKRAQRFVQRVNYERLERYLRRVVPREDQRGRHSHLRTAAAAVERRLERDLWEQPTGGEARCPCAREQQENLQRQRERFPLLVVPEHFRPDDWDASLPPVHYDRRSDCSPVCSGCGTVLPLAVMDHAFAGGNGDGDSPGALVRTFDTLTSSVALSRLSPSYSRAVHFAEFMALWTLSGPRIPLEDMQRIVQSFLAWRAHQLRLGRSVGRHDLLSCQLAREVLRPLSAEARRRYNERWLQIVARLWGEDRFRVEGPPLLPPDVAQGMKQRFVFFEQRWAQLKEQEHPITRGRKNIPFLPCVARQLLYQECMHRLPPWNDEHRRWLHFLKAAGHGDYFALWERTVLRAWRLHEFARLRWYCRYSIQRTARLQNELRVGFAMELLLHPPDARAEDRHILPWTHEYVPLLHPDDERLRDSNPEAWRAAVQECLTRLQATRSRCNSRARSKSVDCGPTLPSGFSRLPPGAYLQTPSWSPPTVDGTSIVSAPNGTSTCRPSSPSTCSTDGLLEDCVRLLQRCCPRSAAAGSASFSVPSTVTDLLACMRQLSRKTSSTPDL